MPSGYTSGILEGRITTLPQFAKMCMRAFGATIHMREEALDKEYEPIVVHNYYTMSVTDSEKRLKEIKEISDEHLIAQERKRLTDDKELSLRMIAERKENAKKLTVIMEQATAWIPPTSEHENFKKYMIEQLKTTFDYDADTKYYDEDLIKTEQALKNIDATAIRKQKIRMLEGQIKYDKKRLAEQIQNCNESNKWVTDLLNSLNTKEHA